MELKDKKIVSVPDVGKFLNLRRTPTNASLVLRKSRGVRPSLLLILSSLLLFHDSQLRMQRQSRRKPRGKQKGWWGGVGGHKGKESLFVPNISLTSHHSWTSWSSVVYTYWVVGFLEWDILKCGPRTTCSSLFQVQSCRPISQPTQSNIPVRFH